MQGYLLLIDEDNLVNTHDTLDEKETTIFNEDYDDDVIWYDRDGCAKNLSENKMQNELGSFETLSLEDSSSPSSSSAINVTRNEKF